ncbi:putative NBD/HSP70 family sugar kinase [Clostridium algifaecis]|uniref:NBD/HSP70 family sugar kinase n=1 Tax=Clostridium algifaecis TaxID=1472040 RepID=A0ABS4KUJ0_9CLOT|nr:ROK family transcriptional regulator [Clostridium algifaecis]MBP2033709.1 putative NBD/HSP70 family sugar kinase [Clostridium algifaecis]
MNKLKSVDQETIKILNQKKIINLLYRNKQLTKQEISQELNISIPTVINNINELIERGIVDDAGVAESTGGRKPTIIRFLPNSRYSFGVCITKDKVRIILTNLNFNIIEERAFDMPEEVQDFRSLILKIKDEIEDILSVYKIPFDKILGIGFSLPGTIDEEKLFLKNMTNFKVKNIYFKEFEKNFKMPIFIENEANASAYAESFINFKGYKNNLVFISITEGIGAGIIINNNVYKGINKRAGEIGHMTVVKNGRRCNCGKKGCWEVYASKKALLNEYKKEFGVKNKSLNDFLDMTKDNLKAKEILDNYVGFLAEGIKNIILIFDPQNIIIGGEVFSYKDLIEEDLINKVFEDNSLYDKNECNVMFSSLGGNAAIFGAALLPMESVFFLTGNVI